jgi:probable phosphoglycerate mutase
MPGLRLTDTGTRLAEALAARLAGEAIEAVEASPLERTMDTAARIAAAAGCRVEPAEALIEIDFGDWTGRSFDELADDPDWHFWNARRGAACCPGGERMADVQARFVDHLFASAGRHSGAIAMVTHCDIIRAGVAHVLGVPLDHVHRFEVAPASITEIAIHDGQPRVVQLNERVH